ncbi:hypothetical protein I9W82_000653 [Candida metapsilosis]|uniref:Uncharacterized protein n=1 Tax=Candida metapsilosis TaxID=273372 RepID=A0A8H7ZLC7_9ASCO|nr:hypothetical protein I9W82_000653 [Candida metapsilosis]
MSEIDRKSILAALRRKRGNQINGGSQEKVGDANIHHFPTEMTSGRPVEAGYGLSDQQEKNNPTEPGRLVSQLRHSNKGLPISAMKEDLADYYHKAQLRTNEALNRIIRDNTS